MSEVPVADEMTMEELLKESAPQVRTGGVVTAYVVDVSATGVVVDVAMWAVPFGILGARIYHVLTHPGDYFFPEACLDRMKGWIANGVPED